MSNEAQIRCSLSIRTGSIHYASQPTAFTADVAGRKGPAPGAFTVSTAGTDADLSELTAPGLCRIQNLDATNYVTFGIWEPDASLFYPLGELLPGETYVLRLSRDLGEQYTSVTGTGVANNKLRFKADTASVVVLLEAFSR